MCGTTVRVVLENFLLFGLFFTNFAKINKPFSKNPSMCIILILNTTFAPNLMFLGILSPETSFKEEIGTHPP